ncbi:hypothetical protein RQP46_004316 [Phenoliferia psychrophenolica]
MAPQIVIVTGSASGMGLATAQTLFKSGYSVALLDLSQPAIDAAIKTLPTSLDVGNKAWGKACDVSDAAALEAFFAETCKELGGDLYGVAHCAGILGGMGPVHEQAWSDIERIVAVNFLGTVKVVSQAVKTFRKQGNAPSTGYSIVTIGSFMIAKPVPGCAVYAATKGAVKTFNQAVAKENAEAGIRLNTVNPGGIRTAMTKGLIEHAGADVPRSEVAMARWGEPEEVANVIEFLLSSKAGFVTGATFDCDGGRNA